MSDFVIAGRSLDEWAHHTRRDDCLERMVPSDLRQLVGQIKRDFETQRVLAETLERTANNRDMWRGQCERQAQTLAAERARCASIVEDILGDGEAVRFALHAIRSAGLGFEGSGQNLADANSKNQNPKDQT